jgi:hypothetical protein
LKERCDEVEGDCGWWLKALVMGIQSKIANLVQITPITMVYGTVLITIVTGAYKPTYNWGASHCMYIYTYTLCIYSYIYNYIYIFNPPNNLGKLYITTSLRPQPGIMVYFRGIIPKWPQVSG